MIELLAGERQKGETAKAIQACNDYLRFGPTRSLTLLHERYTETIQNAPTGSYTTLKHWSAKYGWAERAMLYDAELEAQKNARAREIMQSGLALPHNRVKKLSALVERLESIITKDGDDARASIVAHLRGALDDLAAETGGRVKKQQIDGSLGIFTWEDVIAEVDGDSDEAED